MTTSQSIYNAPDGVVTTGPELHVHHVVALYAFAAQWFGMKTIANPQRGLRLLDAQDFTHIECNVQDAIAWAEGFLRNNRMWLRHTNGRRLSETFAELVARKVLTPHVVIDGDLENVTLGITRLGAEVASAVLPKMEREVWTMEALLSKLVNEYYGVHGIAVTETDLAMHVPTLTPAALHEQGYTLLKTTEMGAVYENMDGQRLVNLFGAGTYVLQYSRPFEWDIMANLAHTEPQPDPTSIDVLASTYTRAERERIETYKRLSADADDSDDSGTLTLAELPPHIAKLVVKTLKGLKEEREAAAAAETKAEKVS